MGKVWVNGALLDEDEARVSVFDHGLVVGDGVFETVKVVDGRPFALTRHLARLRRSAAGLGLPEPDVEAIRAAVEQVVAAGPAVPLARLRITMTGGVMPLGSERRDTAPTTIVAVVPITPWRTACDLVVVPWRRNEHGALAGLKTTSYGENVRALSFAKERGGDEGIFANLAGRLCEGTGTNVFVVRDGRILTPPLSAGCLAGVTRELVLEWTDAEEADLPIEALRTADEAFITSATRGIQPVRAVDGTALPAAPGPVTRKAMRVFAERSAADLDP